jgi:hypothetical protein
MSEPFDAAKALPPAYGDQVRVLQDRLDSALSEIERLNQDRRLLIFERDDCHSMHVLDMAALARKDEEIERQQEHLYDDAETMADQRLALARKNAALEVAAVELESYAGLFVEAEKAADTAREEGKT